MGRKRPERTARRKGERDARQLVRDRERLAALAPGGARERPIDVPASPVIEVRARSLRCPQCEGAYRVEDHQAESAELRVLAVTCQRCGVARRIWFRIVTNAPN
jgi:predicted Zn finger-like uncharacterized protein